MSPIRILLADDNDEILAEVRELLEKEFEIIGTVTNGQDAVEAVRHFNPEAMPVLGGIEASERIRKINAHSKILFLTIQEANEYISRAFSVGASGYVTKRRLLSDLAHGIREVAEGRTFLSPSLRG